MAEAAAFFSRAELLDGMPARRASTLLFAIESRTANLVRRSRDAMARYLTDRTAQEREAAFLEAMAQGRTLPVAISVQDLERYAPAWAPLVPDNPSLRAELARLIGGKYALPAGRVPRITAALGLDDPAVAAAFERRDGTPIASLLRTRISLRERVRWWRSAAAYRLEHMPPFWMAFSLTLTETIGEGVLTVPIAVSGLGPLGGLAVLVLLGIVNLVTIGALVETITRDGDMRYGTAYFGHLVANYLGRAGTAILSPSILVLDAVCLLVYAIGFGSAVGSATGIAAEVWVGVLLAVNVAVLARGSMSATVASAILVGIVNLVLIAAICLVAAPHVDPGLLGMGPTGAGGAPFALTDLGIVFGVILVAYFGHTSTGSAAKVVLAQDPSGRQLLRGNLAAMASVIALYVLATVTFLGVVPASRLVGYAGTPLTPLAAAVGPAVNVLGSAYVVIAIGFGSLYISLSLFNQIREWLPADRPAMPGRRPIRRLLGGPRSRLLIALVPTLAIFLLAEALFATGTESFTGPLGILGLLSCALVGGLFPMLMVAAARRRGDIVPGVVVRAVGHPVTVAIVIAICIGQIALNGLLVWQTPVERGLAALAALAAVALVVRSWRTAAFRPRTVVQVRVDDDGAAARARLDVISDGSAVAVPVEVDTETGCTSETAAGLELGRVRALRAVALGLPSDAARELKVWVHQVTAEGDSTPLPVAVTLDDAVAPAAVRLDPMTGKGSAVLAPGVRWLRVELGRHALREPAA